MQREIDNLVQPREGLPRGIILEQSSEVSSNILRSPSTLLRQGYGGFSSPSSSQQAARYSAKENKFLHRNDFQLAAMFIIMRLILSAEGQDLRRYPATGEQSHLQSLTSESGKFQILMITVRASPIFFLSLSVAFINAAYCATNVREPSRAGVQRRIDLEPCGFATYDTKVLCGAYDVFEDRAAQAGRKIPLSIVVLPALDSKPAPDPVFFLSGGPGQGAAKIASAGEDSLMSHLRRQRDLVFIDQRGTGNSHPLNCNLFSEHAVAQSYFDELFPPEKVRSCHAALAPSADLKLYTTPIAMADLDEVRAALGYDKINLYGISYGTLAALQYLRQSSKRVRALALAGVATPAAKLPLHFAKGAQAVLDKLIRDCAEEEGCHAAFPNLQADIAKVLAKLDNGPVTFVIPNPKSGEGQSVIMSRGGLHRATQKYALQPSFSESRAVACSPRGPGRLDNVR